MSEKKEKAVSKLLIEDDPLQYAQTIDELFEAWLCSNHCDGTSIEDRSIKLTHTKALKRFFTELA